MTYNLSTIMTEAWKIHRGLPDWASKGMSAADWKRRFANCLRKAWANAKLAAVSRKELSEADRLRNHIIALENTDRLGFEGIQRLRELKTELVALEVEERREATQEKRDLITATEGKFASVTFIKKDGTLRQMRVQPASLKFHVKGDAATDAGRKGAETRAARHPHLMPVWDADKSAIRSVNLETVTRIAVGGQVHEFAA